VSNTLYKKPNDYTKVSCTVLSDTRLSWKARGMYSFLVSKATISGWDFNREWLIDQSEKDGKAAYDKGIGELKKYGYLSIKRTRNDNGAFAYQWILSNAPLTDYPLTVNREVNNKIEIKELKEKDIITTKTVVISGQAANKSEKSSDLPIAEKKKTPRWDSSQWYNTTYAQLFEKVSGRPALTKPKQYAQAKTYFALLTECNPNAPPQEIYQIATEGADLVFGSYQHGGPFSWLTTRPDIGVLASQAEKIYDTLIQIKNITEEELIEQEESANAIAELNAISEKILAADKRNQETSPIANALGSGNKIRDRRSRH